MKAKKILQSIMERKDLLIQCKERLRKLKELKELKKLKEFKALKEVKKFKEFPEKLKGKLPESFVMNFKLIEKSVKEPVDVREDLEAKGDMIQTLMVMSACTALAVVIAVGSTVLGDGDNSHVFAAAEFASEYEDDLLRDDSYVPTGIAGVVSGMKGIDKKTIKRIGTSCEKVMVGQRVATIENGAKEFNVSASMEQAVNEFSACSYSMSTNAKMMSDEDYNTLLRIVEAEAGSEDIKGRILVANVIMNRVKDEGFPNTVTEVVWETTNGVPQFSPTYDGRIHEVTVTDETREAVKQVLQGVDYSEGALFFIQKSAAEEHNITWFEKDLKKLFKYGVHEFYRYPKEGEMTESETKKLVHMVVKNG